MIEPTTYWQFLQRYQGTPHDPFESDSFWSPLSTDQRERRSLWEVYSWTPLPSSLNWKVADYLSILLLLGNSVLRDDSGVTWWRVCRNPSQRKLWLQQDVTSYQWWKLKAIEKSTIITITSIVLFLSSFAEKLSCEWGYIM